MPRRKDEHREIRIEVSEEAVEEALAMWITKYHGIEVDRKEVEVVTEDGKVQAKITKRARKDDKPKSTTEATPADST
jgi:hypothetical protein